MKINIHIYLIYTYQFSFSKQNLIDLSILRCNKLSTNISSGWLAFYDLGTKKSFKKLGKFMALVTFEVTNWWSTLIQQHYQLRKFPLKNVEYSIQICPMNIQDVLWCQLIKLIQVSSTSELHENQQNDLLFFEIVPCHFCGALEVQT